MFSLSAQILLNQLKLPSVSPLHFKCSPTYVSIPLVIRPSSLKPGLDVPPTSLQNIVKPPEHSTGHCNWLPPLYAFHPLNYKTYTQTVLLFLVHH